MMRGLGIALALCGTLCEAQTPQQAAPDALALLRKVYQATEKLSYTGTFVYQQGGRTETSRITRVAGPGEDIERVEVLDGVLAANTAVLVPINRVANHAPSRSFFMMISPFKKCVRLQQLVDGMNSLALHCEVTHQFILFPYFFFRDLSSATSL